MNALRLLSIVVWVFLAAPPPAAAAELSPRTWTVDGVERKALLAVPEGAKTAATPVVFAFHGHGGNMHQAARSLGMHTAWPEALVVYPQGLNTPGRLSDPEGKKPGWQHDLGEQGDRDLKFFDAVLAALRAEFRIDDRRIYATGHSNGGAFTYLLWAARGELFAAMAPSGAVAAKSFPQLRPKPVMHVAGETDPLVKYAWQERTITRLRGLNECGEGEPDGKRVTRYPSKIGAPVVTYIHPGGHRYPAEASALIAQFFRAHSTP